MDRKIYRDSINDDSINHLLRMKYNENLFSLPKNVKNNLIWSNNLSFKFYLSLYVTYYYSLLKV